MRRDSDTAAGIGAEAERRTAGGNDRGLTAAAAARRARKIIGIIGPPIDQIVGLGRACEFGHIGLAEDDAAPAARSRARSEEHTSELQSHVNLVCRLLLEKKKK